MNIDLIISELKDKFYNKNTWMKPASACEESVLQTIKSYFLKKNLVVITKREYDALLKEAQDYAAHKIIAEREQPK